MSKQKPGNQDTSHNAKESQNFLTQIIEKDLKLNKVSGLVTRFPPEPNGYLHLGHAKAICINFGLAEEYQGRCHLRFDDTNPDTEETEYVESIKEDVRWLGFDWQEHLYFASDYFSQLYQWAEDLIIAGKAYVCSLPEADLKEYRGDFTRPGKNSPYRDRSVEENLDLFRRMKKGEFNEGEHVLRAKIDMQSPNMNMRDPLLYRIKKTQHHRTGDQWCIYPMYDYAHPLSDAIEGVTHSLCSLEFADHRPFYDWCIENVKTATEPKQYEFARMNMTYLVMSKRKLKALVEEGLVEGWDDPRMPTLSGQRRRGVTPESIKLFAKRMGVSKAESLIDYSMYEGAIRDHLDEVSVRTMAVLDPIKVKITNWGGRDAREIEAPKHPKRPEMGTRKFYMTEEVWIDRQDFLEAGGEGFFRLKLNGEVRLRNSYVIFCHRVIKDGNGKIVELECTLDEGSFGGKPPQHGGKVKGIIHWVSVSHSSAIKVRVFDKLFMRPDPEASDGDFREFLNPQSLITRNGFIEKETGESMNLEQRYQFERLGYFCLDAKLSRPGDLVINQIVSLG